MSEVLNVESREGSGTRVARRLRREGKIPAVLYGHGEASVSLSLKSTNLRQVLKHGAHVVKLEGALSEQALIKDMQWDALGNHILHIDLFRVSSSERIDVSVAVQLTGEAPGVSDGGNLEQPIYELEISCLASKVPEHIEVSLSELQLGESVTVADLTLPEGITAVTPAEAIIVLCSRPVTEVEGVDEGDAPSEPELVGGKSEDESGEGDEE